MPKLLAFFLLGAMPAIAEASDPRGLAYVMLLQVALLAWPLVLPLFYLKPQAKKPLSYFLFVIFTFGSLGIVALPQLLFSTFSAWFSAEDASYQWVVPLNIAKHVIALVFCLWYLPRFRALLRGGSSSAT